MIHLSSHTHFPTDFIVWPFIQPHLNNLGMKKQKKVKKVEAKADDTEEWIKGSNYETHKKRAAATAEKKKAK